MDHLLSKIIVGYFFFSRNTANYCVIQLSIISRKSKKICIALHDFAYIFANRLYLFISERVVSEREQIHLSDKPHNASILAQVLFGKWLFPRRTVL